MSSLDPYYSGSKNLIQTQLDALPGQTQAAIDQADAKLATANDNILAGARRRGLGFSGIPVGEQAQYAATDYAPAIANLKTSQNNKQLSLMESLNGLGRDQRTAAQGIVDSETARDLQEKQFALQQQQFQEQIRQFNESLAAQERQAAAARAASAVNLGKYLGGGASGGAAQGGGQQQSSGPQFTNKDGSFSFSNNGQPITAAQYAGLTGKDFRDVLYQMGSAGDVQAGRAYNILRQLNGTAYNNMLTALAKQSPYLFGGFTPQQASSGGGGASSGGAVKPTTSMFSLGGR